MARNVFTTFLESLKVKHTSSFSNKQFEEHPYKYTLYGISQLLNDYHIENAGVKIGDKDVAKLETPFIAYIGTDFVVVDDFSESTNDVHYLWNWKKYTATLNDFKQMWTGVALLAEPDSNSIEPDYLKHRKDMLFSKVRNILVLVLIFSLLFYVGAVNIGGWTLSHVLLLMVNVIGIACSLGLLFKQLHTANRYADKVCSLFHQKDCNDVLDSPAAKIGGKLSWSEIGLAYFSSNVLLIVICPRMLPYLAIVNLFTLPYGIWSVWYQYKVVKQWCMLCLIVQILLWSIFLINVCLGGLYWMLPTINEVVILAFIYMIPILVINLFTQFYKSNKENENMAQEMRSFKMNESVFEALIKQQSFHPVTTNDSQIIFGNPDALVKLTILTNPHCEPCAMMHKRIDSLLEKVGDKLCIQYVFSSFNEKLYPSNLFLIAVYHEKERTECLKIYREWFAGKKYDLPRYYDEIGVSQNSSAVKEEAGKHDLWRKRNELSSTPTLLINGYKMPDAYRLEDVAYFTSLKLDDD